MNQPVVQIRNLRKDIGKKTIINDLSLDIYPGEVFGFLGPNGAGKTTTIRMMVGLISITKGEILIKGNNIEKNFEKAIAHVGGIVENPEMYKFLSGYKNLVHYARMIDGIKKDRIEEVIKLVGLENRIHDKVKTYSLGMRQRLGIAQAILHSPSLLILDEPTNGLDPAGIREVRDYLRKLAKEEGLAVMVSSHLLSEMEVMCDRIGIIQNGKLVDIQKVNDFITDKNNLIVAYTVDSIQKTKELLKGQYPEKEIQVKQGSLEINLRWEEIPETTAKLVEAGLKVYEVKTTSKTLEDKFLEVTGGNQIA